MQCVVLAGGLGTRLSSVAGNVPKTLMPVGGRPFAEYQLEWLADNGVTDVVYCIGHGGSQVREHLADGSRFGLRIQYVDEGNQLRGTGGALRLAYDERVLHNNFFVLYGDSLLNIDLAAVNERYQSSRCLALMTVFRNDGQFDKSNASFDGRTVLYDKRQPHPDMRWIDYGLMLLSRPVIGSIEANCVVDLSDVLFDISLRGQLAGFEATNRFYEIGTPKALAELEERLTAGRTSAT
jgi:NDP-sugar pyrophosphorylase family protein